ncbi:hypothetical protein [Absidia glauca]|uniref:GAR domain-containing protein n=1 Tax=Absidia glauca TaxID=4829 RepID=A0A168N8Z3_ABSGL|nr:hypothetical protein [Absidia glauca]
MEQLLLDLHRIMDEYHSWTADHLPDDDKDDETPKTFIQSVADAHQSFQDYLEHDQHVLGVFRKRVLFTQATAPIRQNLDWVQAEMLKTTTTDTGIKELESRVHNAGTLLRRLQEQGAPYDEGGMEIDALTKKYDLVHSWVETIRVWFVEAQRIRQWLGERIDLLETSTIPDGILSPDLTITADQVDDLNTRHEALEKEVECFDKEDMTRLRMHVKDLTVATAKEKDLSPADTTTIEITFTTLMTLDRLLHLLRLRSYHLQVLTLRVFWENEYLKTNTWVHDQTQALDLFINTQARWHDDSDAPDGPSLLKSTIIDILLDFEMEISTFDQGQFTTTVNLYQDMDDTSNVELPCGLESRQVGVEKAFEVLVHRATFARQVVEQYLIMTDFMEAGDWLLYQVGDGLEAKLAQQTRTLYAHFLSQQQGDRIDEQVLVDEHAAFQEQVGRLVTETAPLVPFTTTTTTDNDAENDEGNAHVASAIKARSSELLFYGDSLDLSLAHYRLALQWYTNLIDLDTDLRTLRARIDDDLHAASEWVTSTFTTTDTEATEATQHDKDQLYCHWDHYIQQHVDKLAGYQTGLATVDHGIQGLSDFYETSPSFGNSTEEDDGNVTDTIRYLEDEMDRAATQLQTLASTLDQGKAGISATKARHAWETQVALVARWMDDHAPAWELMQHQAADFTKDLAPLWQGALSWQQEWQDFKDRQLTELKATFEQLADSCMAQQQEQQQDKLIAEVEKMDTNLALTLSSLTQRRTVDDHVTRAEEVLRWMSTTIEPTMTMNGDGLEIQLAKVQDLETTLSTRTTALRDAAKLCIGALHSVPLVDCVNAIQDKVENERLRLHGSLQQLDVDLKDALQNQAAHGNDDDDDGGGAIKTRNMALPKDMGSHDDSMAVPLLQQVSSLLDTLDTKLGGFTKSEEDLDRAKQMLAEVALEQSMDDDDNGSAIFYRTLVDRADTISQQRTLEQSHPVIRRIQGSVENELVALEAIRPDNKTVAFGPQQYQKWARKVASSDQLLKHLRQDVQTSMDPASEQQPQELCQASLTRLELQLLHHKDMMDLVRRVLGHSKSADNVTSWLVHFGKAVSDVSAATTKEEDTGVIQGLETKQKGFEPIMASLTNLNTTIQGTSTSTIETDFTTHWKQVAQDQFEKVDLMWKESVAALASVKRSASWAHKEDTLMVAMATTQAQVNALLQNNMQRMTGGVFERIPRQHDISAMEKKLAELERGLMEKRPEIDALLLEEGSSSSNSDCMETQWNNALNTIHTTKLSLDEAKAACAHLSLVDDIDILLDSMDEVLVKAAPDHQATLIDNKYSKAELQAKLIELNARYTYYKLNIQQKIQRANSNNDSTTVDNTVVAQHQAAQQARWKKMMDLVPSRQLDLKRGLKNSQSDDPLKLKKPLQPRVLKPSSSSSSADLSPPTIKHQRLRTVSSSSALVGPRKLPIRQHGSSSTTTTSTSTVNSKKQAFIPPRKRPNAYVAQAGNVLDVEIGRIVNDTPYRVNVKMVPGEVG